MEEPEAAITAAMNPTTGSSEVPGVGLGPWGACQGEAFAALRAWYSRLALSLCSCSL